MSSEAADRRGYRPGSRWPGRRSLERALACAACGAILVTVLGLAASRTLYPYDSGHFEGGLWRPAQLLFRGVNPYRFELTRTPPYTMAPYGPVYYWLVGLGLEIFGPQYWFGRAVAALCALVVAGCVALLVRRFTSNAFLALFSAFLFLAQAPVAYWVGIQRPDMVALALSLGAIALAVLEAPTSSSSVLLAAACGAGAVLTRQTSLLPVAFIVAWYAMRNEIARAAVFATTVGVSLVSCVLLFSRDLDRGFLWQLFVVQAGVAKSVAQLVDQLHTLAASLATWAILLPCLAWALGRGGGALRHASTLRVASLRAWLRRPMPPGLAFGLGATGYFAGSIGLALVTASLAGSNINYWLEACAAGALVAPLALQGLAPRRATSVATVAMAMVAASCVWTGLELARTEVAHWRGRAHLDAIVERLRHAKPLEAPVLVAFPELAEYAGRQYYFNDGIMYDGRSPEHNAIFLRTLKSGIFPALVLPFETAPRGYHRVPVEPAAAPYPSFLFLTD